MQNHLKLKLLWFISQTLNTLMSYQQTAVWVSGIEKEETKRDRLSKTDVARAIFTNANLTQRTTLEKAKLNYAVLLSADLTEADLAEVKIQGGNLKNVVLNERCRRQVSWGSTELEGYRRRDANYRTINRNCLP